jgi:hypothetical protein
MLHGPHQNSNRPDLVRDLNGDENAEQEIMFSPVDPYIMSKGAIFDALMAKGSFSRLESQPVGELESLVGDPLFLQMASVRMVRLEEILADVHTVGLSLRRILRLIAESRRAAPHVLSSDCY